MIVGIHYRSYAHYNVYRSCLLIYEITVVRSLSFSFLDDFEGNANISVTIKSGSTVYLQAHSIDKPETFIRYKV